MSSTATTNLADLLQKHFGFSEFKAGQQQVIDQLVDGRSSLAVFPTGGGKSLCYQLPSLVFDGLTIVVSPLIALMKDQIDQLQSRGIVAVRLDTSLSVAEYQNAMSLIRSGEARILYVAPERFSNERFRSSLEGTRISLFAVDEAHCISQWGHNFRPDYLKLALVTQQLKVERILALTATATPKVQVDICDAFEIDSNNVVCTEFFRPNLHIRTRVVDYQTRLDRLVEKLKSSPPGATIVYVTLQKTAESVAAACTASGLEARAYHAGMNSEKRSEIQEWFMGEPDKVVVATIAFGMGIDKRDIRYVFHFNVPKSIENYAQEIGRAGRDGNVSQCEMFLVPEDRITLENFVYGDTPSPTAIKKFMQNIAEQSGEFHVSQYKLGNECDIKSIVTKTLLTYLELDGFLESTAPRYETYLFKPLVTSVELLSHLTGEKQQFARQLLASSVKRRTWFSIDVPQAVQKLACDRGRIVKALDYFDEQGWIELKVSGLVHGYRKLKPFAEVETLSTAYTQRLNRRERDDIARLDGVFDLAAARECQAAFLSRHFGQPLSENCGQCTFCKGSGTLEIRQPATPQLEEQTIGDVRALIGRYPQALESSRSVARLLCGITSPALIRAKLTRDKMFGVCSHIPFGHVIRQVDELIFSSGG